MKKFQIPLMKKFKKTAIVVVCAVALAAIPPVSNVSATSMQEAQDSKNEAEGNKKMHRTCWMVCRRDRIS